MDFFDRTRTDLSSIWLLVVVFFLVLQGERGTLKTLCLTPGSGPLGRVDLVGLEEIHRRYRYITALYPPASQQRAGARSVSRVRLGVGPR